MNALSIMKRRFLHGLLGSLLILVFLPLGFTQTPPAKGLVASYSFQGSAADATTNGNDGEVKGATLTTGRNGSAKSAYLLNGKDSYLVIPHSQSLSLATQATFSLWWRYEPQASQKDYYTLFEKSDPERGGHSRYGMWLIGDHVEVCIEAPDHSAQNCLDSRGTLSNGWHFIAASFDGKALRIYLDGKPSGERAVTRTGISQSTFETFVGTDQYAPTPSYTRGVVDELRIYNRALSAAEVTAAYKAP